MVYIGIDLGGTGIKAGVVDEQGKILKKGSSPTHVERGHEHVIEMMAKLSLQVIEECGLTLDDVKGIGVGIPGIHDPVAEIVPFCTNLGWHQVPLVQLMKSHIDKPVYVGNDATVAALAESVAGVCASVQDSVFLTLGTGVGGGVVIGGRVFSGAHGVGTELGHMIVVAGGEMCTCGTRGCWERYASATALQRMGRAAANANPDTMILKEAGGDPDQITAKHVMDCAKAGDPVACQVFDEYVYYLCVGIVNIINTFDPEIIALGGGVSAAGEFLRDAVRAKLPEMVFFKTMPYARIELATLGNDAGIIGAAMLGRE